MTATNHALTGAIIGLSVHQPWLALPAAFLSHYVLDAIPHFDEGPKFLESKYFKHRLLADALLCFVLVLILALTHQKDWFFISFCAFLGTSPDLFWINKYRYASQGRLSKWHPNLHSRFASKIQWFAKPIGGIVELVWCAGAITLLVHLLHTA
jgi:hypothetical protein